MPSVVDDNAGNEENVGTDPSEREDEDDNGSEGNDNSDGAGMNEEDSSEQGEKDNAGNEDNLSSDSFGEVLHLPLTETGHVDGLMVSASKKRKKKEKTVEEKDKNEESGDKDSPEGETDTVESEKNVSPPPTTAADHKDGLLVSKKRKRTKKPNAKDGPMPTSEKRGTANQALAAIQAAALQNQNRMNQVMMLNPQMMIQQRLLHNNLMLQAAHVAKASMVMAAPRGEASNNTMGGINSRCRLVTKLGMGGHNCRLVTLELPVGKKLGMVLDNNAASGMPELKRLTPDSPIRHQIPMEFQQGCCIGYLKSDIIGHVQPTTAQECVELITKSKAGRLTSVKMEMLLVQTNVASQPLPIPLVNLPNNRLSSGNTSGPSLKVPPKKPNTNSFYRDWRKPYKALVDYKKQHGNCNVPPSHNPQLAHWIWEQRQKKTQKKLNACRVDHLNEIGFDWTGGYSFSTQRSTAVDGAFSKQSIAAQSTPEWEARYEALVRFKNRCGFFPASGDLHEWIERQKEAVDCISQGRVQKLVEIGLDLPSESLEKLKEAGANFEEWFADVVEDEGGTEESAKSTGGNQRQSKKPKISQGNTNTREKNPLLFWQSAEAAKLFGFHRGGPRGNDNVLKGLEDRIQLLKKANESVNGWKRLIPNDGKEEQYSHHDIMVVRHKAQYLIKAYLLAMKKMNKETWGQCCVMAAIELNELGLTKFSGGEGVARWNTQFRTVNTFPHPKRHVTKKQSWEYMMIFEYFPSAKDMFLEIANENMDRLTGKLMKEEFATTILPALEMESRENGSFDDGSPKQKMLVKLLANPPSGVLVLKWMRHFNIEWDKQCTRKGRDGGSFLSQRMSEAWAAGKYDNRRPKGEGLKKGKQSGDDGQEDNDEDQIPDEDDIADWETHS